MSSKRARAIRRRCRRRGQNGEGLGNSELFLACPDDAAEILAVSDSRLKRYLLGLTASAGTLHRTE
ncbi:MAG: hypothetical protein ACE5EX_00430 [Phycisphaerae bacterium]